jgi:F0F1-type ATP synthase assembly protein I
MQDKSQQKTPKFPNLQKKQANAYLKYSGMAFQMGAIIGGFSYLGQRLDKYFGATTSYWTAGLALMGVCLALYFLLKDVLSKKESEQKNANQ